MRRLVTTFFMLCCSSFGQVHFDGSSDYATYEYDYYPIPATLSVWASPDSTGNIQVISWSYPISGGDYLFFRITEEGKLKSGYNGNTTCYYVKETDNIIFSSAGQVHHVAVVWDSVTNATFYCDGELVPSSETLFNCDPVNYEFGGMVISDDYLGTRKFDGILSDYRHYTRAFTLNEIGQLYKDPSRFLTDTSLVLRTVVPEYNETLVMDLSGNGNTATNHGAKLYETSRGWVGEFDGIDDYLECGSVLNAMPTNGMAIVFEIRVLSNKQGAVISKSNDGNDERMCVFYRTANQGISFITAASGSGYQQLNGEANIDDGEIHTCCVTWDQQYGKRIYIDGNLDVSDSTHTSLMASAATPTYRFRIGDWAAYAPPTYTLNAKLSELIVITNYIPPAVASNLAAGTLNIDTTLVNYTMQPPPLNTGDALAGTAPNAAGSDGTYHGSPTVAPYTKSIHPSAAASIENTQDWTPDSIENLALWFDASDISTIFTNGTSVTNWNGKSSYKRAATAEIGTAPTYGTSNGLGYIDFDGSSQYMTFTTFEPSNTNVTFLAYAERLSTDSIPFGNSNGSGLRWRDNNNLYLLWDDYYYIPASAHYDKVMFGGVWNSGTATICINDAAYTSVSTGAGSYPFSVNEIQRRFGTLYGEGKIYELLAYDRALSEFEIIKVYNYLSAKWNSL